MPLYTYEALSLNGSRKTGEELALTESALREDLAKRGYLVQKIQAKRRSLMLPNRKRIKPEIFMLFNQEFIALLRAGLTIPEALKLAADRPDSPALSQVLHYVESVVRDGVALSEACAQHNEVFDSLYLAAIKTGEKTGSLVTVLSKYQVNLRQRVELARKVGHAMAYPAFLLITLFVILTVLFVFVLPRFVSLYSDFGAQLPLPTRVLILLVEKLPYVVPIILVIAVFGWILWRNWYSKDAFRLRVDAFREKLPLLGGIYRHTGIAQLTRTLATLLSGGMPLVEAMRITADSLTSRYRAALMNKVRNYVVGGETLASAAMKTGLLPSTGIKMLEVGEASGGLEDMLSEIALFHEEALSNSLTRMMALIEPILMLLIGVFVGGIIIVMYLPIFYIVDVIK